MNELMNASYEDLIQVDDTGEITARYIYEFLIKNRLRI